MLAYEFGRGVLLTGLPILFFVLATELYWRKYKSHHELTRKFIHITVGSYAAFWPWFLGWHVIELLALGALAALVLSRYLSVFKSMHLARENGTGELLAAASIGLVALVTHDKWIFMASILQMSLADGLAAALGQRYGRSHQYEVFGSTKSLVGTSVFFIVSLVIIISYAFFASASLGWLVLGLPLLLTLVENVAPRGSDNLLVPLVCALVLIY